MLWALLALIRFAQPIAWAWVLYWLHLGPQPRPLEFSEKPDTLPR